MAFNPSLLRNPDAGGAQGWQTDAERRAWFEEQMARQENYGGGDTYVPADAQMLSPEWQKRLAALGYTGPMMDQTPVFQAGNGEGADNWAAQSNAMSPELVKWMADNGLTTKHQSTEAGNRSALFQGDKQYGDGYQYNPDRGDGAFLAAMGLAAGFAAPMAMGAYGAAGAGAGEAVSGAYGASAGELGSAAASYGGGSLGMGAGYTMPAVGGGAAAGGIGGGAAAPIAGGGGGLLGTGITGSQAMSGLGSLGSFISSPGGAALLGGALGALNGGDETTSVKRDVDPRIAQYIYGKDGNSGLLGNTNALFKEQMAQGGLNPLQRQGLASQQAVLQNPGYMQAYQGMQSAGQGLLGQGAAGNPFTGGLMAGPQNLDPMKKQIPAAPRGLMGV